MNDRTVPIPALDVDQLLAIWDSLDRLLDSNIMTDTYGDSVDWATVWLPYEAAKAWAEAALARLGVTSPRRVVEKMYEEKEV